MAIFADLDENKLRLCSALIEEMAYATIYLQDVREQIAETGWVDVYQNGREQSGLKKSASADVYFSLQKDLNAKMKILLDMVPPAARKSKLEELMGQ